MDTSDSRIDDYSNVYMEITNSAYEPADIPNIANTAENQKQFVDDRARNRKTRILFVLFGVFIGCAIAGAFVYCIVRLEMNNTEKWSSWTDCSVTCGLGKQYRLRQTDIYHFETQTCSKKPCPGELQKSVNLTFFEKMVNDKNREVEARMTDKLQRELQKSVNLTFLEKLVNDKNREVESRMTEKLQKTISDVRRFLDEHKSKSDESLQMLKKEISELGRTSGEDWKWYNGHRYLFAKERKSWVEAKVACLRKGGNLVKIENARENNWLLTQISDTWTWMGANDIGREGRWEWISDSLPLTYTNWSPGEPNNKNDDGAENCVHFYDSSKYQKWNDNHCSRLLPYVCEKG